MSDLNGFLKGIADFGKWSPTDQIKLFAWYVHIHDGKDRFTATEVRDCYNRCGMAVPANLSALINNLVGSKKPLMLKDGRGFRLERTLRERFDGAYGQRAITLEVHNTLRELPAKLAEPPEREYLEEALRCIQAMAYRAAIVMCWNVAYDHLCTEILKNHLSAFNAKMAAMFPKEKMVVASREDFYEFNENRVLEVCRAAGITDKNVHSVLDTSLKTRNRAAHASGSTFKQPQAENYILELLNNAILKL